MSQFEYYVINLNDGMYVEPMMEALGEMLAYCTEDLGLSGQKAMEGFIGSGLARDFERQNPVYVLGKSGVELAGIMVERMGGDRWAERDVAPTDATWASWIGEMVAFYQATSGDSYEHIMEALPYPRLVELAIVYASESTPETFAEILAERIGEVVRRSRLQQRRSAAGLSQSQLAQLSGVSLRALQQYEQGAKNINHASAASLYRLSLVLGCTIEDLLEAPVR